MYPSEYLYSKEHEWVRVQDDICVLGITEFAQQELGEVVYVELPSMETPYPGRSQPSVPETSSLNKELALV